MQLKETVEDPAIIERISNILIPREFTKLDEIIDLVFFTAEDIKEDNLVEIETDELESEVESRSTPVSFHEACVRRIEARIRQPLIKQSRTTYSTADNIVHVSCAVSKEYVKTNQVQYWFAFHPYQKTFLENANDPHVAFGCGTERYLLDIPFRVFSSWLNELNTTEKDNRIYWHVHIHRDGDNFRLIRKGGVAPVILDGFLIS
jgi:hypothetical protein